MLASAGGKLYLWDPRPGTVEVVCEPGRIGGNGCARGSGGDIWMVLNGRLTRYDSTNGGELIQYDAAAGELSAPITVAPDGTVYARRRLGIASFRPPI